MYWIPKFRNANPFPVPLELPDDDVEMAKLALKRMAVDLQNQVTVYQVILLTLSTQVFLILVKNYFFNIVLWCIQSMLYFSRQMIIRQY